MSTRVAPAGAARSAGRLLTVLGVVFGVAVTIGNTIGSGILRTPGEIAARLPHAGLFMGVWVLGGVYALLGSNALAELAAMVPESGGYTVFVRRGLGRYAGFVVGWSDWLSSCSSAAAAAIVIGEYTGVLVPLLANYATLLAMATVLLFTAIQWRGIRAASATQEVTSALKALAFLALVVVAFLLGGRGPAEVVPAPAVPAGSALLVAIVLAMQGVIFTYDGFAGIAYFGGEVKDPARDIPRSIFGGVLSVIVIYLLVNAAFLYVLPMGRMAGDPLVAGAVAGHIFGPRGDTILRGLVVLSLLSAVNAILLIASRVFYGVSSGGLFPAGTRVSERGTPGLALLASTVTALAFIASGTFEEVIAVTAFFFVANYTLSFLTLFVLRWRAPEAPRPFRSWGHPWTTAIVLLGSFAFFIGAIVADPRHSLYALVLLALTWPLYRFLSR